MNEVDVLVFFGRPWQWMAKRYLASRNPLWLFLYLPYDFMYRPHLDHARMKRGATR